MNIDKICYKQKNCFFFEYTVFKQLANKETYTSIIKLIVDNIDAILAEYEQFDSHLSFKMITISDADKHFGLWKDLTNVLKERYKSKLNICYIYDMPGFFAKCYDVAKMFIDKDTQGKIQFVKNPPLPPLPPLEKVEPNTLIRSTNISS
jgi:hypothetical protein